MYLTIMKPQMIQLIAVLARGLWIVEGPDGPVLVIKVGKESTSWPLSKGEN